MADRSRPRRGAATAAAFAAGLLAAVPAAPAVAGWAVATAPTGGTLTAATARYAFSGADPAAYTVPLSLVGTITGDYATVGNPGTVPARLAGSVQYAAGTGALRMYLWSCTVPWSGGACAAGATPLVSDAPLSAVPAFDYGSGSVLAPGAVRYLKVQVVSLLTPGWLRLGVSAATLPAGGRDRTRG